MTVAIVVYKGLIPVVGRILTNKGTRRFQNFELYPKSFVSNFWGAVQNETVFFDFKVKKSEQVNFKISTWGGVIITINFNNI